MKGSSREEMLGKIRSAVGRELTTAQTPALSEDQRLEHQADVPGPDELVGRFEAELTRIGGRCYHASSVELACGYVERIAVERHAKTIVGWESLINDGFDFRDRFERRGIQFKTAVTAGEVVRDVADADVGVTDVDYALAETGSLVLLTGIGRARSVSLLPSVHVAFVKPSQIIPGFDELFAALVRDHPSDAVSLGSAVTFITGPSRTADIELTLVLGVHGPQELHVVLLDSPSQT